MVHTSILYFVNTILLKHHALLCTVNLWGTDTKDDIVNMKISLHNTAAITHYYDVESSHVCNMQLFTS